MSDLKDVFDAINRLCDTMKTSTYSEPEYTECNEGLVGPEEVVVRKVEILRADRFLCEDSEVESDTRWGEVASPARADEWKDSQASLASSEISVHREPWRDIVSPTIEVDNDPKPEQWKDSQVSLASSEVSVQRETQEERWSDTLTSPPSSDISVTKEARERWSDCRSPPDDASIPETQAQETASEVYYTASSEVSLLSDTEVVEKVLEEDKGDKKEVVISGHVAAMRERFESMTRANTPCPDLVRSSSPSLDVFRNITPSPDRLG